MWLRMRLIEALLMPSYRDLAQPSGFTGEARLGVGAGRGIGPPSSVSRVRPATLHQHESERT